MKQFSAIYQEWIDRKQLQPHKAAPLIGVSIATSYKYVNGQSLPPGSKIAHLAACMGVSEKSLRKIITQERSGNRKRSTK